MKIISSSKIEQLLKETVHSFQNTHAFPPFWICTRKEKVDFRSSSKEMVKQNVQLAIRLAKQGHVVVIPLIFYHCQQDYEKSIPHEHSSNHYVDLHYNILLIYYSNGIVFERYEPHSTLLQGNFASELEKLFAQFSEEKISFQLFAEKGLQTLNKDKLCGHHILYWISQRLKFGKKVTQFEFIQRREETYKKFIIFAEQIDKKLIRN